MCSAGAAEQEESMRIEQTLAMLTFICTYQALILLTFGEWFSTPLI
jgi:hypothetical protein